MPARCRFGPVFENLWRYPGENPRAAPPEHHRHPHRVAPPLHRRRHSHRRLLHQQIRFPCGVRGAGEQQGQEHPPDDRIHRLHGGEQDLEPGEDPEKRYGHRVRAVPLQRNTGRHQTAEVGDEPDLPEDESAGLRHVRYQRERPVPRGEGEGAGRGKSGKDAGIPKGIERRTGRNGDPHPGGIRDLCDRPRLRFRESEALGAAVPRQPHRRRLREEDRPGDGHPGVPGDSRRGVCGILRHRFRRGIQSPAGARTASRSRRPIFHMDRKIYRSYTYVPIADR